MKAHGSALCTLQKYFYKTHSIETVVTTSRRTYTTTNAQLRLFIILLSVSATITGTATTATTTAATTTTTEIEQLVVPGPQSSNDELTEGALLTQLPVTSSANQTNSLLRHQEPSPNTVNTSDKDDPSRENLLRINTDQSHQIQEQEQRTNLPENSKKMPHQNHSKDNSPPLTTPSPPFGVVSPQKTQNDAGQRLSPFNSTTTTSPPQLTILMPSGININHEKTQNQSDYHNLIGFDDQPNLNNEADNSSSVFHHNPPAPSRHHSATSSSSSNKTRSLQSSPTTAITGKGYSREITTLNHISDKKYYSGKHLHNHDKYGPHFEDVKTAGNVTNITVQSGRSIFMNCRISLLQDKTVSWVRRYVGQNELKLLTVGHHTYSGDPRYTVEFLYPNNWRLKIANVNKGDEGAFFCQISSHPVREIQINLHINAPKLIIIDELGDPLQDKYYEVDSTIKLSCIIRDVMMPSAVVFWNHSDQILNYDTSRGGISVKTDFIGSGANSTLLVAKVNKSDSGNYSCSISPEQHYTVTVHVLNGESYAELHHGNSSQICSSVAWAFLHAFLLILLQSILYEINR